MALERRTYSAPLSYVGSLRRITDWATRQRRDHWLRTTLVWTAAITGVLLIWMVVTMWYAVVFGLFGLVAIPFRLIRRGQRRRNHLAEAQLQAMQALVQQGRVSG